MKLILPFAAAIINILTFCTPSISQQNLLRSDSDNCHIYARINQYDFERFNFRVHSDTFDVKAKRYVTFQNSDWEILLHKASAPDRPEAVDYTFSFICKKGQLNEASVSADILISDWSVDNYVLMPGAAYNGNRYQSRRISYSPKLLDPRDIGPDKPIILSDIPKLNEAEGPSRIQERSGSMTTPSLGFYAPKKSESFWLLTSQGNDLGDYGIDLEENRDRTSATISITAPVVRELYKYRITDMRWPSDDKPANFKEGDSISISFRLYFYKANSIQSLFDQFVVIRKDITGKGELNTILPFSSAFSVQEEKFNTQNFVQEHGYYSVGMRENFLQDWQIGWTGGMITTYPLLIEGSDSTRQNVVRNFDWLFPAGISPSGLFWDSGEKGTKWYGGDIRKPHTKNWHLVRKSGDGLYYVVKQLMLMEKIKMPVKENWKNGTMQVSDAFIRLWRNSGQLGQFVDNVTGEIQVGGSTSGAIVPAALALSSQYFSKPEYLNVAEEIAEYYYLNFVKKGITNGGPGDALQNFDSESSYALVESYATLYDLTGNKKWLYCAEEAARQFSTWVISYNYKFPTASLFGKEKIHSLGAVNANTQNKHGAPGICTYSGLGLLMIYRATGNPFYIELLRDIAHNMPQYLSHPQKPIEGTKTGWVCERVSTTDWLEGIGEISYLSTWAETSLMLTYAEIPGLYVQPDRSFFIAFDNIKAELIADTDKKLTIRIKNPTKIPAEIKVLEERRNEYNQPLGQNKLYGCRKIVLGAGKEKTLTFVK